MNTKIDTAAGTKRFSSLAHHRNAEHLAGCFSGRFSNRPSGFSLIELLIVVAIVGIIAAVGYPSYGDYVNKTRRSDAQLALMNATQSMERCRTTNFSYAACALPANLQQSEEGNYAISVVSTASTFMLTATAQNVQANDTDCPTLTLNDQGVQGHTGAGPCW